MQTKDAGEQRELSAPTAAAGQRRADATAPQKLSPALEQETLVPTCVESESTVERLRLVALRAEGVGRAIGRAWRNCTS